MTVRLFRLASLCLLGAALGAGIALVVVLSREMITRSLRAAPTESSSPAAPGRSSVEPERSPGGPARGAQAAATSRPATGAPARTARICLMALGTHDDYRTPNGGRADLVIVSPEEKPSQVLRKARVAHPEAKVFAYLNTMDIMLSRAVEGPKFWEKREGWFLHDSGGERIRVRVKNYSGNMSRYGMNVAHPGWQGYLAEEAVRLLKAGYDGIQLDNVETAWSYRLRYVGSFVSALPVELDEEGWYAGETALLRAVRKAATDAGFAGREIIFNHMRAGELDRSMEFLAEADGANAENWMDLDVPSSGKWGWRDRVDLARRAAREGKRTNLLCQTKSATASQARFGFASYLMAIESDRNTFWYGVPYRVEGIRWYDFFDADLGRPSGEMREVGVTGVFRRDFEKGVVLINPGAEAAEIGLGRAFWDDLYEEVLSVSLGEKEAALLLVPTGAAPERRVLEAEQCVEATGPTGAAPGLVRVDESSLRAGSAVMLDGASAICALRALVAPGRYRVVVEGRGQGKDADAVFVKLGEDTRRIAFDRESRRTIDLVIPRKLSSVDLKAAEPGVIVDRVTLIRLGEAL